LHDVDARTQAFLERCQKLFDAGFFNGREPDTGKLGWRFKENGRDSSGRLGWFLYRKDTDKEAYFFSSVADAERFLDVIIRDKTFQHREAPTQLDS
jgi:hypothetical protein